MANDTRSGLIFPKINKETEVDRSHRCRSGDSAEFHYKETPYKFHYNRPPMGDHIGYSILLDLKQADSP